MNAIGTACHITAQPGMLVDEQLMAPIVIDAEFVEEPAPGHARSETPMDSTDRQAKAQDDANAGPPKSGYGRASNERPPMANVIADVLGAVPSAAKAAASVARAVGKDGVAETIEGSGEMAAHAAAVAATVPDAIKGIDEKTKPLREALARFSEVAKARGFVSRGEPKTVAHAPKTRHGKPMEGKG